MLPPMGKEWNDITTHDAGKHQIQEIGCNDNTHYGNHEPQTVIFQGCESNGRSAKNEERDEKQ